jgi:F0F1-type ATP synthase delta subunit
MAVFDASRWAAAFTELCGKDIDEGAAALKIFVAGVERLAGITVTGTTQAKRLEALLRAALAEAGFGPANRGAEIAVRLLVLLVKRNCFKYRLALLGEVEKAADRAGGVIRAALESAEPVTAEFERELETELLKKTGAERVALSTRINTGLLAGFRLYIGSDVLDTSLRERLRIMRRSLERAEMVRPDMVRTDGGTR